MPVQSHVKEMRMRSGISAAELARQIGVSRQTVYAIEDGKFIPNTAVALKLARVLDVRVDELFSIDEPEDKASRSLTADWLGASRASDGQLVRLSWVHNRLIAVPASPLPAFFPAADAVIESATSKSISMATGIDLPADGKRLVLAGCDPALSLLSEPLHRSGMEILPVSCSSRRALQWLKDRKVHIAGSHLLDHKSGDYNVAVVRRLLPDRPVQIITFALWEQGLLVKRGNPKGIRDIADLGRPDVTLINREKGSGSRDLLDTALRRLGIPSEQVKGYRSVAGSHLAAAYTVATGSADCCIAPQSAARCFGLEFIALAVERFDLVLSRRSLEMPATKVLLDLLNGSGFQRKLRELTGYDTSRTGHIVD